MDKLTIREMEELIDYTTEMNKNKKYSKDVEGLKECYEYLFKFMGLLETYYNMRRGK